MDKHTETQNNGLLHKITLSFKDVLSGDFDFVSLKIYMLVTSIFTFLCLGLAIIIYPEAGNYSVRTHMLSSLGDYTQNPQGWLFFTIGILNLSLSTIPIIRYSFHRILNSSKKRNTNTGLFRKKKTGLVKIGYICSLIGVIAGVFIAIMPDVTGSWTWTIHNIACLILFAGSTIGIAITGITLIRDDKKNSNRRSYLHNDIRQIEIPFFAFVSVIILITGTQIYSKLMGFSFPQPGILSFSIWQAAMIITVFSFLYLAALYLPKKIKDGKNE